MTGKTASQPVDVSYLVLLPYGAAHYGGKPNPLKRPAYAPYFFNVDIESISLESQQITIDGTQIRLELEVLDHEVLVAHCYYQLREGLTEPGFKKKNHLNARLKAKVMSDAGLREEGFVEEYTSLLVRKIETTPGEFVSNHRFILARMIRSLDKKINEAEMEEILSSQVSYSTTDMTIVDWEGAIIITDEGDFESDLELIKIGNYQLIRYRMLDRLIDTNIEEVRSNLKIKARRFLPEGKHTLRKVVESQIELMLHFDRIDQSLLLIGDWYSAKLYRTIVDEFYIDPWRANVKEKLQTLAQIDEIVRHSLTFSWGRFLDFVQIAGWMLLLVGYAFLFVWDINR